MSRPPLSKGQTDCIIGISIWQLNWCWLWHYKSTWPTAIGYKFAITYLKVPVQSRDFCNQVQSVSVRLLLLIHSFVSACCWLLWPFVVSTYMYVLDTGSAFQTMYIWNNATLSQTSLVKLIWTKHFVLHLFSLLHLC